MINTGSTAILNVSYSYYGYYRDPAFERSGIGWPCTRIFK